MLGSILLLAATSTFVSANGQGQQPQALIVYNTTLSADGSNTQQTLDYLTWNQNLTLNGISATSMSAAGGNAAADVGYSCIFASGGNPGRNHTISLHGPAADLATNPVEIKWICCGDCASGKNSGGNGTSSTTKSNSSSSASVTGPKSPTRTGNGTLSTPTLSSSPAATTSTAPDTNIGAISQPASAALLGIAAIVMISFGL